MIVNQFKVAILFYMLIAIQEQPESKHDHNHEHHHKHPHDHDHDHHRRSEIRKASRIYNGVRTPPGRGKFMAVMLKSQTRNHCSAVIITGDMLLTAAHCFTNLTLAEWAVMRILPNALPIQTYRVNPNSDHPLIKRIINYWIHPRFNPNSPANVYDVYDIAIIRIGPQPWQLGNEVDSALMPVRVTHVDWRVIKAYGYGLVIGQRPASYLNEMNFRHYSGTISDPRYHRRNNEPDVFFLVTNWSPNPNRNPRIYSNVAPGDSGGGIFIQGTVERFDRSTNRIIYKTGLILVGIIFRGSNSNVAIRDLNRPYGAFAVNVSTMMPWINSIVGVDFVTYPFPVLSTTRIG